MRYLALALALLLAGCADAPEPTEIETDVEAEVENEFEATAGLDPGDPWDAAKMDGASFRAVGNEPGWDLTIYRDSLILFNTNYGEDQYAFPEPTRGEDPSAQPYIQRGETDDHTIEVALSEGPCADTMADKSYETTVVVTLDDQTYNGCGQGLY